MKLSEMDAFFDDDMEEFSIPLSKRITPPEPIITVQSLWSCPICFDGIGDNPNKTFSATKCGHLFCNDCLHAALKAKSQCPMCKTKVHGKNGSFEVKLIESVISIKTGIKIITKCGHLFAESKPIDQCPTCGIVIKSSMKLLDIYI